MEDALMEGRKQVVDRALEPYAEHDECPRSNLTDILADLQHWAAAQGLDFDAALRSARLHFEVENQGS